MHKIYTQIKKAKPVGSDPDSTRDITGTDTPMHRIAGLAATFCEMPLAMFCLPDGAADWKISANGIEQEDIIPDHRFWQHTLKAGSLIEINDPEMMPAFADSPWITGENKFRFFTGVPLINRAGMVLGVLALFDRKPRTLLASQKKSLLIIASEICTRLDEGKRSEQRSHFETLFQLSNDLVFEGGLDGYFKNVNPAFESVFGWTREQLLSKPAVEFYHPDDVAASANEMKRLASGENTVNFIQRFRTSSGIYKFIEWTSSPKPGSDRIFGIGRDITQLKKKDRQIAATEEKLRAFFENSECMMFMHDMDGRFLTANRAMSAILGYSVEELVTMNITEIGETKAEPSQLKAYLDNIESEGRARAQSNVRARNGTVRTWLYNNVMHQDSQGKKLVIGSATDITELTELHYELKSAKESLERTSQLSQVGGWEVDLVKQTVVWSKITREIHGVPADFEPDLASGINFYKEGESREKIAETVSVAIQNGTFWDLELEIVNFQGKERWVRTMGQAEMENGVSKRLHGSFQDITDKKTVELDLKRTKLLAEKASIAKSEFLANMSHEIRTPLNGVIGFTDLVMKTELNEVQHQYLETAKHSANALLEIINDILDFSKIEAGKLELNIEKCDLAGIGAEATDITRYAIQKKGLELLLNIPVDMPDAIWVDSVRLKQVLLNLLGNAAKFTDMGEIELKIVPVLTNGNESTLRFSVRDTGIGIKKEQQEKIFEAFSQEDSSTTKKYGGTGLGLAISNKLLALMGSRLELSSTPGTGSVFSFELTVKSEKADKVDILAGSKVKKVLLVDDNANNRLIVKEMLLAKSIDIIGVRSGREALRLLSEGEYFDLIVMDQHMPLMTGLETIRKWRDTAKESSPPVFLLHAAADEEQVRKESAELKIDRSLIKPVKPSDLYDAISGIGRAGSAGLQTKKEESPVHFDGIFNILIVEDNTVNMMLTRAIVERIAPYARQRVAWNGREAVSAFRAETPDVILMDIQMPEMTGYEATEEIRKWPEGETIPIIAFTAGNMKDDREKCLAAGMNDLVVKPVAESAIVDALKKWLPGETANGNSGAPIASSVEDDETAHLNLKSLQSLFGKTVIDELMQLAIKEVTRSVDRLKDGVAQKDLPEITQAAHKLCGTSGSAGLPRLAALSNQLQNVDVFDKSVVGSLFNEIETEADLVLQLIRSRLAS